MVHDGEGRNVEQPEKWIVEHDEIGWSDTCKKEVLESPQVVGAD